MIKKITLETIKEEIKNLGVKKGDILFLSADLLRVGYYNKSSEQTLKDWVNILIDAVGEDGTLIIPANTNTFPRFIKDKNLIFRKETPPDCGSLSLAFFKYANVIRSRHPTNSCFGLGKYAEEILTGHDEYSGAYSIYGKIIEHGGKNLMLGTASDKKNCPMPFHYVQELLGHTSSHPSSNFRQCYFEDLEGNLKLFKRKDVGGCTSGGFNTYGRHIAAGAIKFGNVGKSVSALVDTNKSFEVLMNIFTTRPSLIQCDNKNCVSCYGRFVYNRWGVIPFYIRSFPRIFKKFYKYIFSIK